MIAILYDNHYFLVIVPRQQLKSNAYAPCVPSLCRKLLALTV